MLRSSTHIPGVFRMLKLKYLEQHTELKDLGYRQSRHTPLFPFSPSKLRNAAEIGLTPSTSLSYPTILSNRIDFNGDLIGLIVLVCVNTSQELTRKYKLVVLPTSAAGFPFSDTHSNSISWSSVVTKLSPCSIFGGSGDLSTLNVAYFDRMPCSPRAYE